MLVSIIVPVYNAEKYLVDCIKSILSQENNDKIIVIDKPNDGVSIAKQIGINHAHGDWIVFVDEMISLVIS